jgi:hypothetical protein
MIVADKAVHQTAGAWCGRNELNLKEPLIFDFFNSAIQKAVNIANATGGVSIA